MSNEQNTSGYDDPSESPEAEMSDAGMPGSEMSDAEMPDADMSDAAPTDNAAGCMYRGQRYPEGAEVCYDTGHGRAVIAVCGRHGRWSLTGTPCVPPAG